MTAPLLQIENLTVRLTGGGAARPIVDGVSLHVARGEAVGLVGESGSGKSVTCRAALGLLPEGAAATGALRLDGDDILTMSPVRLRELRRQDVSMIFQDPRASINPLRRIGDFVTEGMRAGGVLRKDAIRQAEDLLESVGIREPRAALRRYPHEFSGGMLQRVMIAGALAGEPRLLLADEPTTALDVTTQAEVISILTRLQAERDMGMLFVTHDLELAAAICDRIYVMYAGRIVEAQSAEGLFGRPRHPYTVGLLAATPRLDSDQAPHGVPGRPLSLAEAPAGCAFAARCAHARPRCGEGKPVRRDVDGAQVACLRVEELIDE
ncbi:oligopeptide/dipeptide ABC transporter ATP-binding protein [Nonomuraea polychroma]|uniref:Oligopeptide/dipeptide ABC transporter ATP-binding protein n=1 Tax=Nonomuraea polychroma TaxID=46176 RepID=A0A438LZX9_9ACTN|nr:ABC transporter ATP-binding protein [Nonomuraea polychroma]RVX39096.1 oligopeptide/dipeptide ABC transporter ATP-binding protein [Nonomuraea polychroma]